MKRKTIVIFDWDDTLFPTTWLSRNSIKIDDTHSTANLKYFKEIDLLISNIFKQIINKNKIIIVTNASVTWVKLCMELLPNTKDICKDIDIYSSREQYQEKFPNDNNLWKKMFFSKFIKAFYRDRNYIQNIMSVGDADYEYLALIDLFSKNKNRYIKTIKLLRYPSKEEIYKELYILNKTIIYYINQDKDIDLNFNYKKIA